MNSETNPEPKRLPIVPILKEDPDEAEKSGPSIWVPPGFEEPGKRRPARGRGIPFQSKSKASETGPAEQETPEPTSPPQIDVKRGILKSRLLIFAFGIAAGIFVTILINAADSAANDKFLEFIDPLENKGPTGPQSESLEKGLSLLREGQAQEGFATLRDLERANPTIPSLSYFIALAALQSGNTALADKNADASIAKRERIADSLALKAVIETQKPRAGSLGDPTAAAEALLQKALIIEPGNPAPLIELSTILRHKGDNDGALELLRSARNRLSPVDSHAVAETTIRLLEIQALEDKDLPTDLDPDSGTSALFSAAYVAMRTGRFAKAASHLNTAKKRLPPDLFLYLVNDPALRRFNEQPELTGFFD